MIDRIRTTLAKHLGQQLTPAVAAAIEAALLVEPDLGMDVRQFAPREYRGLTFRAESFRAIRGELEPLHEQQWHETERARAGLALRPDYRYAEGMERRGQLLQLTARDAAGALVGNIRLYLFRDVHTSTPGAREDTFYLAPHVRRGFVAVRFWQYAEQCLRELGVLEVRSDSKVLHDAHGNVIRDVGRLNEYLGYTHVANHYLKRLGEPARDAQC